MHNFHNSHCTNQGLLVVSDMMPGVRSISIDVLVKAGSRHETEENGGISHFLEHMAFKGTTSRTAMQIAEEFDLIGGHFNAYTGREYTVYYVKILQENLEQAIDILSDILQYSTFSKDELEKERKVILEELAQTHDTPDVLIFDLFQEAAFPGQALGRPIIGTEGFIKTVSCIDLSRYISDKYGYDNIIISAAGNFSSDMLYSIVEQKFNNLSTTTTHSSYASVYRGGINIMERKELEQVHIVLGFQGSSYLSDDYYVQKVLSLILGGSMSSRLFQAIREKLGLAYNISSFTTSYVDTGIFGIYSATNESAVPRLLQAIREELLRATEQVSEQEVTKARAQVRADLLMAQESSTSRAQRMAFHYAAFNRFIPIEEIISKVDSVDVESIQHMMHHMLTSRSLPTLAAVGRLDSLHLSESILDMFRF